MGIPLRVIRDRVRERIRDTDRKRPTFDTFAVDACIASKYLSVAALLPPPDLYTASAFTIGGGGATFTLPATVTGWTGGDGQAEYREDIRIQLAASGQYLTKLSWEEMDSRWNGTPLSQMGRGIPQYFAIHEDKSQVVQGRIELLADGDQVCNLYASLAADDLRDYVGGGTDDLDDVEVQFSRLAALVLELMCAAELLARMRDPDAAQRRMDREVAEGYAKEARTLLLAEMGRRNNLDSSGRTQRWVS